MTRFRLSHLSIALVLAAILPLAAATHQPRTVGETSSPLPYMEYLPDAYLADPNQPRPLLVFLHGDGESGPGTVGAQLYADMIRHGPHKEIAQGSTFFNQQGMLVLSPQFEGTPIEVSRLKAFIDWVREEFVIDRSRIYLTGLSNGAISVWFYARSYPQDPAALLPIAGGDTVSDPFTLVGLPIWAFHNYTDGRFSYTRTTAWLNGIASAATGASSDVMAGYPGPAGGDATAVLEDGEAWSWRSGSVDPEREDVPGFTLYAQGSETDQHDAWTQTYDRSDVWQWLASQRRPARERRLRVSVIRQGISSTIIATAFQNGAQVDQQGGTAVDLLAPTSLRETRIRVEETMDPVPQ